MAGDPRKSGNPISEEYPSTFLETIREILSFSEELSLLANKGRNDITLTQIQPSLFEDHVFNYETLSLLLHQAVSDLKSLQTPLGITASSQSDQFHAIFGRDSLWSLLLSLEAGHILRATEEQKQSGTFGNPADYDIWLHQLAATVLRGLGSLQGRVVNDTNEEQPGRIIHEYWNPLPQRLIAGNWPLIEGRYYGSFDATFLYVTAVAQVHAYFHDTALLEELWPSIEAALSWMLAWSDLDQDGLVEYQRRNPEGRGLVNQVWKDSTESVQPRKYEQLQYPLAWIELQGYAWAAYANYLELAKQRQSLNPFLHQQIQLRMEGLQQGLQRFWLADEQFPAIALDGHKHPIQAVSSNPGHLLWSGILNNEQATHISQRLMQPDLCTTWGIRTLSDQAYYYNPFLYQCGTIWPFDNAIAAVGLRRYGYDAEAMRIAQGILKALQATNNPVELYMVLSPSSIRWPKLDNEWILLDYAEACNVQAWTSAGTIYLTSLLLSSQPNQMKR
jgi:glycogen debranching enzyme